MQLSRAYLTNSITNHFLSLAESRTASSDTRILARIRLSNTHLQLPPRDPKAAHHRDPSPTLTRASPLSLITAHTMATHILPKMSLRRCTAAATASTAPAARTFFQLAHQRGGPPMLDFLLPSIPTIAPRSIARQAPRSLSKLSSSRSFTASALRAATAIYNPRKDDDGNDMTIEITPRAANVSFRPESTYLLQTTQKRSTRNYTNTHPAPQPNHSPRPKPPPRPPHHR